MAFSMMNVQCALDVLSVLRALTVAGGARSTVGNTGANAAGGLAEAQHGAPGIQFDFRYPGLFVFLLFFVFHKAFWIADWFVGLFIERRRFLPAG